MQQRNAGHGATSGFTLIELIMVVAIVAIISTIAVTRFGDLQAKSARKVSLANQQVVGRTIDTFLATNGKLNKLDSFIDAGTALGGTPGFDFAATGSKGVVGGVYCGPDDDTSDPVRERNDGLHPNLARILCEYTISQNEARALQDLGLKYVMQFNTYANLAQNMADAPSAHYTCDDRSIPQCMDGLDAGLSACIVRTVTNGMVFAAITPKNARGRLVYQECGQNLVIDDWYAGTTQSDSEIKAEVAATGGPILALGLGSVASVVGDSHVSLDAPPYSEVVDQKYYRQYVVLVRLHATSPKACTAEFVGVVDPEGNSIRRARYLVKK